MTNRRAVRARKGALQVIAILVLSSAIVRLSLNGAPALAEGSVVPPDEVSAEVGTQTVPELLAALQERETQVAEREALIEERSAMLQNARHEVEQQLAKLEQAERSLAATLALAEGASEADLNQLTAVYENMKPAEAADVFAEMSPEFAAGFLGMMRPDAAAMIMTELEPDVALSFSVILAGRNANTFSE